MLGENNVSSARSETEVSFRIDDLVGEAMELVPDRAGVDRSLLADITRAVCASLLPVLQSMVGGMFCKCSGDAGKVKVARSTSPGWLQRSVASWTFTGRVFHPAQRPVERASA